MSVHFLPVEVQSRLRSGIAITCPRQCVEELVLNSLDAGATCIAVRVNFNLMKIQVIDNGTGITHDQLELVGERYATSKCHSLSDLDKLEWYGYRGEALASIRDVSGALEVVSRSKRDERTFCKIFNRGKRLHVTESTTRRPSVGTTCTVHSFLHNLPVRRENVRAALDLEDIRTRVESIALIHPRVKFSLRNDATGAMCVQTQRCDSVLVNFCNLFGEIRANRMQSVTKRVERVSVEGYVSEEGAHNKNLQFVYVNRRLVLATKLHKIVNSCFAKYFSSCRNARGRYAIFVLNLSCPLSDYDVSFEPSKTLVEFADWESVTRCVEGAVDAVWGNSDSDGEPVEVRQPIAVEKRIEMRDLRCALTSVPAKRRREECATTPANFVTPENFVTPPNRGGVVAGPVRKLKLKYLAGDLVVTSLDDYVRTVNGKPIRKKIVRSLEKFVYEPIKVAPTGEGMGMVDAPKRVTPMPTPMPPTPMATTPISTTTTPTSTLSNCRERVNRLREKIDRAKSRQIELQEEEVEVQPSPVIGRCTESCESTFSSLLAEFATENVEDRDEIAIKEQRNVANDPNNAVCDHRTTEISNFSPPGAPNVDEIATVEQRKVCDDPNKAVCDHRTTENSNFSPPGASNVDEIVIQEQRNVCGDPNWIVRTDGGSNKTIYVHKITGNSTYSAPAPPNVDEKAEKDDRRSEFASTIYLGSAATPFNSRGTSVRAARTLDKWRDRESTLPPDLLDDLDSVPACPTSPVPVYNLIHPYKFSREMLDDARVIRQVDRKFIACKLKRGLIVLFDQHAVHERIRLEELQAELDSGEDGVAKVKSVSIDPPMDLTMRPDEIRIVGAFVDVFAQWGFEVSVRTDECVRARTMPRVLLARKSVLRDVIEKVFLDVICELRNSGTCSTIPRSLLHVLHSLACKGAVKFGDFLETRECEELVALLRKCRMPFQCAHGRPAIAPLLDLNLLAQFREIKCKKRPKLWKLQFKYDYTRREEF